MQLTRNIIWYITAGIIINLPFFSPTFSQTIKSLEIKLEVKGTNLHSQVEERIMMSIRSVGERAILNRSLSEIRSIQTSLEKVFQKIFNQVLTGFYVSEIKIEPAERTVVSITIQPATTVIKRVWVKIELSNIHPDWKPLLDEKISKLAPKISPILIGIPVSAYDWSQYVIREILDTIISVNAFFPGFEVETDLNYGEEAIVLLKLRPQEPLIRKVGLKLTSETLPTVLLAYFKTILIPKLNMLIGLPVKFVENHKYYLKEEIVKETELKKTVKYGLTANPVFYLSENSILYLNIESQKYEGRLEGGINIGLLKPNPEVRGYLGRKISPTYQISLRTIFIPSDLTLKAQLGLGKKIKDELFICGLYELKIPKNWGWIIYQKEKIWIEIIADIEDIKGEGSIGYWLRNFLRVDVVGKSDEKIWIRVVIDF